MTALRRLRIPGLNCNSIAPTSCEWAGGTDITFTQLEFGRYQLGLAHGTVTFRVLSTSRLDREVDTPSLSVRPSKNGSYRIAVNDSGETAVTARGGEAEVFTPHGSTCVRSGQMLLTHGSSSDAEFQIASAPARDAWDRWNDHRDQAITRSAGYTHVAFLGFGGGAAGLPFGNLGGVPLAPYEVLHPWWGRGFSSVRPYLNQSINITSINTTSSYRNAQVTNGFLAVSSADFRGGRFGNLVRPEASSVRGAVPIAPDRSNLQPTGRPAAFIPGSAGAARLFTHEQPNPAPSIAFAAQRTAFGLGSRKGAADGASRDRFGTPGSVSAAPGGASAVVRSNPGWRNAGQPRSATASNSDPEQPTGSRGWDRFGAFSSQRPSGFPDMPQVSGLLRSAPSGAVAQPRLDPPSSRVKAPVRRDRPVGGGGQRR